MHENTKHSFTPLNLGRLAITSRLLILVTDTEVWSRNLPPPVITRGSSQTHVLVAHITAPKRTPVITFRVTGNMIKQLFMCYLEREREEKVGAVIYVLPKELSYRQGQRGLDYVLMENLHNSVCNKNSSQYFFNLSRKKKTFL